MKRGKINHIVLSGSLSLQRQWEAGNWLNFLQMLPLD